MQLLESSDSRRLLSFAAPIRASGGGNSITAGDINGDRFADVAFLVGNKVSLRLGNGDGTFQRTITLSGHQGQAGPLSQRRGRPCKRRRRLQTMALA